MNRIVLLLLVVCQSLFAQFLSNPLLKKSEEALYSFDFVRADSLANNYISKNPDEPFGYYYLAKMHLWFYLGCRDQGEYEIFQRFFDLAVSKADQKGNDDKNTVEYFYFLGNLYQLEAFALTTKGNTFDAFWATKKSFGYYEDAIDTNPEFYDAYLGIGVYKYALSYVPSFFKWMIDLVGLDYDRRKGLEDIKLSFEKGRYSKTEAAYHLSRIYIEYNAEYDSSEIYLKPLIKKFPQNVLFNYQYAILKIEQREFQIAEKYLRKVLHDNNPKFSHTNSFSQFLLAEIKFRQDNFSEARKLFNTFLEKTRSIDYSGIAYYYFALCDLVDGDTLEAKKNLVLARNGNSDLEDDNYAKRRSEFLYVKIHNKNIVGIVLARNALFRKEYNRVIEILESILDDIKIPDLRAEALLILGEAKLNMKDRESAERILSSIRNIELNEEKWLEPYSYLLLAQLNHEIDRHEIAKEYLNEAEETNEYDYRRKLEAKINRLKNRINQCCPK